MNERGCLTRCPARFRPARCTRTRVTLGLLPLGLLLLLGLPAAAQEAAPPPPAEPPKIDVTGFVDVYYSQHSVLVGLVFTFGGKI